MISIVVPVYNIEQYLTKCIDSLLAQTYQDIEIILVDDGSTDTSPAICDYYAESYIGKVKVIHSKNRGLSAARNLGILSAQGEYIGFVDGDDWVENDMFEILFKHISKTHSSLSTCSLHTSFEEEGYSMRKSDDYNILTSRQLMDAFLRNRDILGYAWNKLYKTELAKQTMFDETLFSSEDIDFCVRYAQLIDNAVATPSELYHYRQRRDSMTGNMRYSYRKLSVIKAHENILPTYKAKYPDLAFIVEKYQLKQCLNVIGRMKISKINDKALEASLREKVKKLLPTVLNNNNNSIIEKANIILTCMLPGNCLRIKQWILKRRYAK